MKRHSQRNHELELECYVISMIAKLRFVRFGANEREREREWFSFYFLNFFMNFFSRVENFLGIFIMGCDLED